MGYSSTETGLYVPWVASAGAGFPAFVTHLAIAPSSEFVIAILEGLDFAFQGPSEVAITAVAQIGGVPFFSDEATFDGGFGYTSWRGSLALARDELNCESIAVPVSVIMGIVAWGHYVPAGGTTFAP